MFSFKKFPYIRRIVFWQARQTFPAQLAEIIKKNVDNWRKKISRRIFFEKFPWRGKKQSRNTSECFPIVRRIFPLVFQKKNKLCILQREKISSESFLWKWESSFENHAKIFLAQPQDIFAQCLKKKKNNQLKKLSQKFFFGPANFIFGNPTEIFPTRFRKNSFCCPKIKEKSMIWKTFFSLKCFYGHVECSCKKPAKKEAENVCSVSKRTKNFNCFREQFFFKKHFHWYEECSFDRPTKLFLLNYRKWSEKVHKRFKNFSKIFSSESSHGEVESRWESLLTFFGQPGENFPLDIQKKNNF